MPKTILSNQMAIHIYRQLIRHRASRQLIANSKINSCLPLLFPSGATHPRPEVVRISNNPCYPPSNLAHDRSFRFRPAPTGEFWNYRKVGQSKYPKLPTHHPILKSMPIEPADLFVQAASATKLKMRKRRNTFACLHGDRA